MSQISSVAGPTTYTPAPKAAARPASSPKPASPVADHDHDGDTDGPGIDVKG